MLHRYIKVKTSFVGMHRYPGAPDNVAFLRNFHRHIFEVTVTLLVVHSNRDLEFFTVKQDLENLLVLFPSWKTGCELSCEMMAEELLKALESSCGYSVFSVEVSEDGENSGIVVRTP